MDKFQKDIAELLNKKKTAPFLFVGSGVSRRYLNAPTWKELLSKFAPNHFNSYVTKSTTRKYPEVARMIASDVNEELWNLPETDPFALRFKDQCVKLCSALRFRIKEYLERLATIDSDDFEHIKEELELLKQLKVDGVVTTNWDLFLESTFSKFKTYIGQNGLLTSSTHSIGEIYKIHGCISKPESMILTDEDYDEFNRKNPILAAKLLTIFTEHPIIFIGYSLSDENIKDILTTLLSCYDPESIEKLKENLIFIEWDEDPKCTPEILTQSILLDRASNIWIPITKVRTHYYSPIYKAINQFERQIPAHLLRAFKDQFYQIITTENPEKKIYVASSEQIEDGDFSDVEFVCGFGVIANHSDAGFEGYDISHILDDYFIEDKKFDRDKLISITIAGISGYIPVYKYFSTFSTEEVERLLRIKYNKPKYKKIEPINQKQSKNKNKNKDGYRGYKLAAKGKTFKDIIEQEDLKKALLIIPFVNKTSNEDLEELYLYLQKAYIKDKDMLKLNSNFRKCVAHYDYLKYKV